MRILHVHGRYYQEGGAETGLRALVEFQQASGHEPGVIYADRPPAQVVNDCPTYFCSPSHGWRSGLRALPEFKSAVADFAPDLVHLHVVQYDISPVVLRWLTKNLPTVMTIHDTLTLCPKPVGGRDRKLSARILPDGTPCTLAMGNACLKAGCLAEMLRSEGAASLATALAEKFWRKCLYRQMDRLLVNSAFTRAELVRNRIPAGRIEVLPVPLHIPPEWSAAAEPHPANPPLLLFVGQLSIVKGAGDFVAMLERLQDMPWQAGMVGAGPERARIEARLRNSGLDRRVGLHGAVARKELAGFYRRASLLVFPTLAPESLGLVGLEAMWFGCPVVAYNVGAIHEWLQDGRNGRLVKPGEITLLANCLRGLLENRPQLASLREQAAKTARQWLSTNRGPATFNELYLNVRKERHADRH
jgi:glycosyltransferase involved in cell wall biosynthesis